MDYFYCPPEHIDKELVIIEGEEFSHLSHVMRKNEGDEIRVVDGKGNAYDVRLEEIKKKTARGIIYNSYAHHHESNVEVTLAVGILKNPSKFDFLVEKAVELGVKEIIPMQTERTIPSHAKVDRWQKLALAAMKQSCRSYLPQVKVLSTMGKILSEQHAFGVKVVAHEKSREALAQEHLRWGTKSRILVMIGPEGGFSDEEIEKCVSVGVMPVSLGERRLRSETAAIVASALILC
jgi:16S rRNA (uracil1498-N3)-methyltransferase